jgi:hypothetical protein
MLTRRHFLGILSAVPLLRTWFRSGCASDPEAILLLETRVAGFRFHAGPSLEHRLVPATRWAFGASRTICTIEMRSRSMKLRARRLDTARAGTTRSRRGFSIKAFVSPRK